MVSKSRDARKYFLSAQSALAQVAVHPSAEARKRFAECEYMLIFLLIAHFAPARMITILLASSGIASGGLEMPIGHRTDPDLGPGRRDGQRSDACQGSFIVDCLS